MGGESNTDVSPQKEALLLRGAQLSAQVTANMRSALSLLLSLGEFKFSNWQEVRRVVGVAGHRINHRLVPATRSPWRRWDTGFAGEPAPDQIKSLMREQFYPGFMERFNNPKQDPVEFALWVERQMLCGIHPQNDGCTKLGRVLAAWVLARSGLELPRFQNRGEFYETVCHSDHGESLRRYRERASAGCAA